MFDSTSCKECHAQIYEQWEKSHHSRSLMGIGDQMLLTLLLKRIAEPETSKEQIVKHDLPCFKCHLPQAKYGTDAVAREIAAASLKNDKATVRKLNISCLVCHQDKALVHGRPEEGVVYGGKDIPDHPGRPVKAGPLLKNSLMCGQCHGLGPVLDSPEMPVQCATLYGSYLHAYIPSGGAKTCQECHMKSGDHYMPPNFNDRDELSARLRESLPMEVQTLAYTYHPTETKFSPMVVVKTKITSKAGHRIPDGWPAKTQVVLDVIANTPDGKKIYEVTKMYASQATDSRSTLMALGPENKLGFIRDTSIQPFAPKEETIEIPLPQGLREAEIEVSLSYRPRPDNVYPIHHIKSKVSLDQNR